MGRDTTLPTLLQARARSGARRSVQWGEMEEKGLPAGGVEEEEARRLGLQEEPGSPTEGDQNSHLPLAKPGSARISESGVFCKPLNPYGMGLWKPVYQTKQEPNESKLYYGSLTKA